MMADAWNLLGYFFGMPPREAYPKAEGAAQKALSLDNELSDAHHSLAAKRFFFDWNFPETERGVRRALDLNPNNPDSLQMLGLIRTVRGSVPEGVASSQRAIEADPTSQWRHIGMAFQYACAGRITRRLRKQKRRSSAIIRASRR